MEVGQRGQTGHPAQFLVERGPKQKPGHALRHNQHMVEQNVMEMLPNQWTAMSNLVKVNLSLF